MAQVPLRVRAEALRLREARLRAERVRLAQGFPTGRRTVLQAEAEAVTQETFPEPAGTWVGDREAARSALLAWADTVTDDDAPPYLLRQLVPQSEAECS